jgi:hypothetical protein
MACRLHQTTGAGHLHGGGIAAADCLGPRGYDFDSSPPESEIYTYGVHGCTYLLLRKNARRLLPRVPTSVSEAFGFWITPQSCYPKTV